MICDIGQDAQWDVWILTFIASVEINAPMEWEQDINEEVTMKKKAK